MVRRSQPVAGLGSASNIPTLNFAKNAKFRMGHPSAFPRLSKSKSPPLRLRSGQALSQKTRLGRGTRQDAHRGLDDAVLAAYGWPKNLSAQDILTRLLQLNLERSRPPI